MGCLYMLLRTSTSSSLTAKTAYQHQTERIRTNIVQNSFIADRLRRGSKKLWAILLMLKAPTFQYHNLRGIYKLETHRVYSAIGQLCPS